MLIFLSISVALSMMVAHFLTSVDCGTLISISIALGCTTINVCTFVDACTLALDTSFSSTSYCIACALIDGYSTPSSSSDSSMCIRSTNVAPSLTHLNSNLFYVCAKTELQMFQLFIYLELSYA